MLDIASTRMLGQVGFLAKVRMYTFSLAWSELWAPPPCGRFGVVNNQHCLLASLFLLGILDI